MEKRFPPSPRKLRKAREEGDVAKSPEFTSALALSAGLLFLFSRLAEVRDFIEVVYKIWGTSNDPSRHNMIYLTEVYGVVLSVVIPFFSVVLLAVLLAEILQVGLTFSFRRVTPQPERLQGGWKRLVLGGSGFFPAAIAVEAAKRTLHLVAAGAIFAALVWRCGEFLLLPQQGSEMFAAGRMLFWSALVVLLSFFLVLGVLTLFLARCKRIRRLSMDAEEMKRELRESEGDPELRAMRRHVHGQLLQQGLLQSVRKARLIIRRDR